MSKEPIKFDDTRRLKKILDEKAKIENSLKEARKEGSKEKVKELKEELHEVNIKLKDTKDYLESLDINDLNDKMKAASSSGDMQSYDKYHILYCDKIAYDKLDKTESKSKKLVAKKFKSKSIAGTTVKGLGLVVVASLLAVGGYSCGKKAVKKNNGNIDSVSTTIESTITATENSTSEYTEDSSYSTAVEEEPTTQTIITEQPSTPTTQETIIDNPTTEDNTEEITTTEYIIPEPTTEEPTTEEPTTESTTEEVIIIIDDPDDPEIIEDETTEEIFDMPIEESKSVNKISIKNTLDVIASNIKTIKLNELFTSKNISKIELKSSIKVEIKKALLNAKKEMLIVKKEVLMESKKEEKQVIESSNALKLN